MTRHKKKAWNSTNPLYRYLHGGGKRSKRGASMTRRHRRKGGFRKGHSRGGGLGGIGKILSNGMVRVGGGILGAALVGAAAGYVANNYARDITAKIPGNDKAVALIAGGVPGLIGNEVAKMALPMVTGGNRLMGGGSDFAY